MRTAEIRAEARRADPDQGTAAERRSLAAVEAELIARWPETTIDPTLARIELLLEWLGQPQRTCRAVHLTGTNGKTSTARLVEALLIGAGLRTGRLTSPHLSSIRERICLGGRPLGVADFVQAYHAVAERAVHVDAAAEHPLSFFEMTVAMAYRTFSDREADAAVIEVGMGGRWDATNVIDAEVAVIGPVDLDHADYLGPTVAGVAREKAGIIKTGSVAVSAPQTDEVARILRARAEEVGARLVVMDEDFGLLSAVRTDTGQLLSIRGLTGTYEDVPLSLHGRHQAENAAVAVAAAEALLGRRLDDDVLRAAWGRASSPGRFEIWPGTPPVVLDAAHNPHGARALARTLADLPADRTVAVVAVMADKDHTALLHELGPAVDEVVCTQNASPRSLPAEQLAAHARQILGEDRVHLAPDVATALSAAIALCPVGSRTDSAARVLVTGSVVTVGDARSVLTGNR
jgi:dihydrofolate synthase/folylpolyglutamate synthase